MSYRLLVNPSLCTGCRLCELVCSLRHEKQFNPERSRIRILKVERSGLDVPITCLHCNPAYCIKVCPTGAMVRDEETGAVVIRSENCISCGLCISLCPVGAPAFEPEGRKVIKCDLCDGDPRCVKFCGTDALLYDKAGKLSLTKKRIEFEKIQKILSTIIG